MPCMRNIPRLTKPHAGLLVSPQKAYWRAHAAVQKLGWTIVDASEKDLRIEATDQSLWFGRVSDIVIRVRQAGTIGSRHRPCAPKAAMANCDHGRNAARLKAFFTPASTSEAPAARPFQAPTSPRAFR